MRCYYLLDQPDMAKSFAIEVYNEDSTPSQLNVLLLFGLAINYDSGDLETALNYFNSIVEFGGAVGAEVSL